MGEITRILNSIEKGDTTASDELLPVVYEELRKLASYKLSKEKASATLQPTLLVHEAYLRLVDVDQCQKWSGRGHFFAAAAEAMRRIIVENARQKKSQKRGGGLQRVSLDTVEPSTARFRLDLLALNEALDELEQCWPEKARVVKLRYFVGMTISETSDALGISHATTERHWRFARAWLFSRLNDTG